MVINNDKLKVWLNGKIAHCSRYKGSEYFDGAREAYEAVLAEISGEQKTEKPKLFY